MSIATSNEINKYLISEHLIKNLMCGKNLNEIKFRILRSSNTIFDSNKIESIYIHLDKPKLCKQKVFYYS